MNFAIMLKLALKALDAIKRTFEEKLSGQWRRGFAHLGYPKKLAEKLQVVC